MAFRKRAIPWKSRQALAARHGCRETGSVKAPCARCGFEGTITRYPSNWVHFQYLEIDHIRPELLGGNGKPANLQLLCQPCNRSKGHRRVGT